MSQEKLPSAVPTPAGDDRHLTLVPETAHKAFVPTDEPVVGTVIRTAVLGFFLVAALFTVVGVVAGLGIGGALGVGVFVGFWGGIGWGGMAGTSLSLMRDHRPEHVTATVPTRGHQSPRRES
jgi:hypothetical protein